MPKRGMRPRGAKSSQSSELDSPEDDSEGSEVVENSEHSENEGSHSEDDGTKKGKGRRRGGSQKTPKAKKILPNAGVQLTTNVMVHNSLLYFLLMQYRKLPVKRSEIVKHAINMQSRDFPEVITKLDQVFGDTFGMRVIGIEESASQRVKSFSTYILISKYSLSMTELVTIRPIEVQCKRTCLFLILTLIFMLNRPMEEETIWSTLENLGLNSLVCAKAEDLKRFLRTEYVNPLYLQVEEISENDRTLRRYSWGARADLEFSKYEVLKFAAKQFRGKKPSDFTHQYLRAMEQEREIIEADEAEEADHQPTDDDESGVRSMANRSGSISHDFMEDSTEGEDDPEQVDLDIQTDEN